jgi:hypothetical protein
MVEEVLANDDTAAQRSAVTALPKAEAPVEGVSWLHQRLGDVRRQPQMSARGVSIADTLAYRTAA